MSAALADSDDLKQAYALQLLLCHGDAMQAARAICTDLSYSLFIAERWPTDLAVMRYKQELIAEHGEAFFLPSKYDVAHMLMQSAERSITQDGRLKALKLYAELMDMLQKPGVVIDNSTNTTNKVMVVERYGNNEEWEQAAIEQQRKLITNARQ